MKKLISMIMAMSMISALSVACGDDDADDTPPPVSAPAIVLENGDIDEPQEITPTMSLKVSVTAPGTITGFTVSIDSPALTEEILALAGLAKELDLVNPGSMADGLTTFGFPVGDKVKDKTSVSFDISQLVPMIAQIYTETSDHKFILKVTDAKGQSTTKTLTCHLTEGPAIVLEDGNIDQPQEIASEMSLKVSISAPATISGFTVTIDSPALTEEMLATVGLAKELDLVNPGNMEAALKVFEFPVKDEVKGQTAVLFDVSKLVPMIAMIYNETSDHKFILKVTDANDKTSTKTLTCHLTGIEAPVITLENGDIDQPQEIVESMSLKVSVAAPGTIAGFTVTIDSPALTEEILALAGLAKELDLVNPGDMGEMLTELGFPVGDGVKGKTSLSFDISQLVPMIAMLYNKTSDHKFILTVTDAKGQSTTKTLTCHLTTKTTVAYNNDADLWANTATVTATLLPEGGSVQYRVKGAADWIDAELVEGSTYKLVPVWISGKNNAGVDVYSVQSGTGVFAATTYEVRVVEGGETINTTEFTTAVGDVIPNGDMSGWSTRTMKNLANKDVDVPYPNKSGDSFWGCGNNGVTTGLCVEDTDKSGAASPAAKMQSSYMVVLASGNLFTGDFDYNNYTGTVQFGKKYTYTARPKALKVNYHATVGEVNRVRKGGDVCPYIQNGEMDKARIFVAIVDWSTPHTVVSATTMLDAIKGNGTTQGSWNPEDGADASTSGKILGYASMWITASTEGDAMVSSGDDLEIYWYDKDAAKPEGNYTIVISCAANAYGDYMTGCDSNCLYVDDFEWVY